MNTFPRTFWVAVATVAWFSTPASAITISLTDPNPHYSDIQVPCAPNHSWCGVFAHLFTDPLSYNHNYYFDDAFAAWNGANPANAKWTINDGGALNATLNVEIFDAKSFHDVHGVGGVEIQIDFDYNGNDRSDFVWSQGLYLNYKPDDLGIYPPYSSMDTANLSNLTCDPNASMSPFDANPAVWCAPVYPYQYTNQKFYDFPKAPYDTGFFEADAFLSKVDYTNRSLTIYEGVHYGFCLAVPEPQVASLLLIGIIAMWATRRRQHPTSRDVDTLIKAA